MFCKYNKKSIFFNIVDGLFIIGCIISFIIVLINPDNAVKFFIFSSILSIPIIYKNHSHLLSNKKILILPLALLSFGLLQIIWVSFFKQDGSPFTATYRSYQNGGKSLIFTSLIITAICSRYGLTLKIYKIINIIIILTASGLYCWAGYEIYSMGHSDILNYRVTLGFEFATGTAYALTFIALLASQSILNLHYRFVIPLYFLHFILSSIVIISTQTRAAIIVYPVMNICLFLFYYRKNKRMLFVAVSVFVVLSILMLIPVKTVLKNRYIDFENDITAYKKENSNTSIGARLAMQRAGLVAGNKYLWGESLEQRNITINELEKTDQSLSGAIQFSDVHLHNEIIDTFSLKGIPGVMFLLFLYAAIIYSAFIHKNIILFITSGVIIAYGLSDLLLYSKSESLSCMLALCFSFILRSHVVREN